MKLLRSAVVMAGVLATTAASAQSWQLNQGSYALKGGESVEISDLYWVVNCRSLLTQPPEATILDGPPNVSVEVQPAPVLPRFQQCSRPVKGGKLILKAGNVDDPSDSIVTVRLKYTTKDGVREKSMTFSLSLFPAQ